MVQRNPHHVRSLWLFLGCSALFALLSVAQLVIALHRYGRPEFVALWPPLAGFDFYVYLQRMRLVHQPTFFSMPGYPWYYPAPAAIVYWVFYLFCSGDNWYPGYAAYFLTVLLACSFAAWRLRGAMQRRGSTSVFATLFVAATFLLSWPIFIALQRGNLEAILWLVLAMAIWAVCAQRWMLAAILLGAVASVKLYPILCLALFLNPRRWKEIGVGLFVAGGATALSLRFLQPDMLFAAREVANGIHRWTEGYASALHGGQAIYDHSLFLLVRIAVSGLHLSAAVVLQVYLKIVAVVMLAIFLLRVYRLPVENQVLFLITASVLLPPASFDYTLQNLYIPFAMVVLFCLGNPKTPRWWSWMMMGLFAIEFSPLTFLVLHHLPVGGPVKGIGLVAILSLAVVVPMRQSEAEETQALEHGTMSIRSAG